MSILTHMNYKKVCIRAVIVLGIIASSSCAFLPLKTDGAKQPKSKKSDLEKDQDINTLISYLTEKTWLLSGYQAEPGFILLEPEHGSEAFIVFKSDKSFYGTTGINRFMGRWKISKTANSSKNEIILEQIGTTLMAAPNEVAAQFERDILDHLNTTTSLKTGKDTLSLYNSKGQERLTFIFQKDAEAENLE